MEKLKLSNNQEFVLIPMGIVTDASKKVRYFKFTSALSYWEISAIFSDSANLSSVDYIQNDGATKTYQDCVKMLVISFVPDYRVDDNTTADIYVVTVSTDAIYKAIELSAVERQSLQRQADEIVTLIIPEIVGMVGGEV